MTPGGTISTSPTFNSTLREPTAKPVRREEDAQRHERLATFAADIGMRLVRPDSLQTVLQHCAEAMVGHLDAALARIWTVNDASRTLELQASAACIRI